MKTVGIDGCTGGWIAILITESDFRIRFSECITDFTDWLCEADCALIDMPIGLPENEEEAKRRPEAEARRKLGKKASSVFNVPCRQALHQEDYASANEINRKYLGKGLSKQSFYIGRKIREVDLYLSEHSHIKNKLKESHPELLFSLLTVDGLPVMESKKTKAGIEQRLQILSRYNSYVEQFKKCLADDPLLKKRKDDAVDAYCLSVAGQVGLKVSFHTIPQTPIADARGLFMCMTYPHIE